MEKGRLWVAKARSYIPSHSKVRILRPGGGGGGGTNFSNSAVQSAMTFNPKGVNSYATQIYSSVCLT